MNGALHLYLKAQSGGRFSLNKDGKIVNIKGLIAQVNGQNFRQFKSEARKLSKNWGHNSQFDYDLLPELYRYRQ